MYHPSTLCDIISAFRPLLIPRKGRQPRMLWSHRRQCLDTHWLLGAKRCSTLWPKAESSGMDVGSYWCGSRFVYHHRLAERMARSKEYQEVKSEVRTLQCHRAIDNSSSEITIEAKQAFQEFAQPFSVQSWEVTKRVFQQTWRDHVYIYSKLALCLFSALFIGFSFFKAPNT